MVHAVLAVGGKQLLTRKHSASTTIWVRKAQRNKEALCEHHNLGSQSSKEQGSTLRAPQFGFAKLKGIRKHSASTTIWVR
jgi:hypothetical protein